MDKFIKRFFESFVPGKKLFPSVLPSEAGTGSAFERSKMLLSHRNLKYKASLDQGKLLISVNEDENANDDKRACITVLENDKM